MPCGEESVTMIFRLDADNVDAALLVVVLPAEGHLAAQATLL